MKTPIGQLRPPVLCIIENIISLEPLAADDPVNAYSRYVTVSVLVVYCLISIDTKHIQPVVPIFIQHSFQYRREAILYMILIHDAQLLQHLLLFPIFKYDIFSSVHLLNKQFLDYIKCMHNITRFLSNAFILKYLLI